MTSKNGSQLYKSDVSDVDENLTNMLQFHQIKFRMRIRRLQLCTSRGDSV